MQYIEDHKKLHILEDLKPDGVIFAYEIVIQCITPSCDVSKVIRVQIACLQAAHIYSSVYNGVKICKVLACEKQIIQLIKQELNYYIRTLKTFQSELETLNCIIKKQIGDKEIIILSGEITDQKQLLDALASHYSVDQNFFQVEEFSENNAIVSFDDSAIFDRLHLDILEPEFSYESVSPQPNQSESDLTEEQMEQKS